jgi:hypothetical protein
MHKDIASSLIKKDFKTIVESIRGKEDINQIIILIGKEIISNLLGKKFLIAYFSIYDLEKNTWLGKHGIIPSYYTYNKVSFRNNIKRIIKEDDIVKDWNSLSETILNENIPHGFRDYIFEVAKNRKSFVIVNNDNISGKYPLLVITSDAKGADKLCKELDIKKTETKNICRLLQLLNGHFLKWRYIYYIVSPIYRERSVSGVSIFTSHIIKESTLLELLYFLSFVFLQIDVQLIEKIQKFHALRSAVAAIMARNWAHIFASQVLLRFRFAKIEGTSMLSEYISKKSHKMPEDLVNYLKKFNIAIPEGLLDYIATRSEYIADVTGEVPLLWGEGYIETKERGVFSGIIEEFRQTYIIEKLREAAGGKFKSISIVANNLDQRIGIPFGMAVGRHCIYGILENYIRNVSKYGSVWTKKLVIKLSGSAENKDRESIVIKLTSNSRIAQKRTEYKKMAKQIDDHVSQPIIDETGALPSGGWGFREMKIHACILAGEDIQILSKKGKQAFFLFDLKSAKKAGEYCFYFKVRQYKPFLLFKDRKKVEDFIQKPLKFPLADFIVINRNLVNFYYTKETWEKFPTRICILGTESSNPSDPWLKKKVIYIDNNINNIKEGKLYENFWDLLKKHGAIDFEDIRIFESYGVVIITSSNGSKIGIYHADEKNKQEAQKFVKNKKSIIRFSHQKCMMIWMNEVSSRKKPLCHKGMYKVDDEVLKYKWKALLGSQLLIIDKRLFEQYEIMNSETKDELQTLGIYVVPETIKIDNNLNFRVNDQEKVLSQFQFISVHLGYLEENPDTPLLCKDKIKDFPPFIFMHTARGKIDREFITKYWWFKKIISAGSIISSFNEEYGIEIKIRLMSMFLSPQQGGLRE